MKSTILLICLAVAVGLRATTESKPNEPGKDATPSKPDASDKFIGKEAGQVRDDNGLKMKLVWCPPGFLTMENVEVITEPVAEKDDEPKNDDEDVDESKDEPAPKPRQTTKVTPVKVFLTQGYWLGKYEVTQFEWKQVMKTEPWKGQEFAKDGDSFPATYISWDDAMAFCRKLTVQERKAGRLPTGWEYTLPTEAQWERACRAQTETRFSFGDDESKLGGYAWFRENAWDAREQYSHRVGQKKPNPWGLHDMHGNTWEWCRDLYQPTLPGGRDPESTRAGSDRVLRGGSWSVGAAQCRSGYRFKDPSVFVDDGFYGFRVTLRAVK